MREITKRVITGISLTILILLILYLLPASAFLLLVFIGLLILSYEFYKLLLITTEISYPTIVVFVIVTFLLLYLGLKKEDIEIVLLYLLFIFLTPIIYSVLRPLNGEAVPGIYKLFTALIFLPLGATSISLIREESSGSDLIVLLFTIIFFGDSFAYFTGKLLGKHKLAPEISPKKTWEGSIGGIIGNILAVILAKFWYLPELIVSTTIILSIGIGIIGQIGDLFESIIKRGAGAKDSGNILPGHGGLWDRIDALIVSAPIFFIAFRYYCNYFISN